METELERWRSKLFKLSLNLLKNGKINKKLGGGKEDKKKSLLDNSLFKKVVGSVNGAVERKMIGIEDEEKVVKAEKA